MIKARTMDDTFFSFFIQLTAQERENPKANKKSFTGIRKSAAEATAAAAARDVPHTTTVRD